MIYAAIYRLAIGAYFLGVRIAALFKPKAKLFIDGRAGLLPKIKSALASEIRPRIWMHCASLGEFEQGRPLLEAMREQYSHYAFVLTFFSPSGYEVRKNYDGADYIFYLPLDTPANAKEFLDLVQPKLCLFIKYELWFLYLSQLAKRRIPTFLVCAIFNERQGFFKWYGGLQRKMLSTFTHIFVQDAHSVALLNNIGINNVSISGDTRFDRVIKAAQQVSSLPIANEFCTGHKILVAGSTWEEDEQLLYNAINELPADWKIIIVPHEVDAAHVNEIEKLFGRDVIKWSEWEHNTDKRVLLVDKVGFLLQLYKYGTAAWIGGAFGKAGVHNVLEPAVYGIPCFYGPVFHQFLEAEALVKSGGAVVINNAGELARCIKEMDDPAGYLQRANAAAQYVAANGGATGIVLDYLSGKI